MLCPGLGTTLDKYMWLSGVKVEEHFASTCLVLENEVNNNDNKDMLPKPAVFNPSGAAPSITVRAQFMLPLFTLSFSPARI